MRVITSDIFFRIAYSVALDKILKVLIINYFAANLHLALDLEQSFYIHADALYTLTKNLVSTKNISFNHLVLNLLYGKNKYYLRNLNYNDYKVVNLFQDFTSTLFIEKKPYSHHKQ